MPHHPASAIVRRHSFHDDRITFANELAGVEEVWKSLVIRESSSPKLWMDAWLTAFARCYGFQVITTDKAFSQFNGLNVLIIGAEK